MCKKAHSFRFRSYKMHACSEFVRIMLYMYMLPCRRHAHNRLRKQGTSSRWTRNASLRVGKSPRVTLTRKLLRGLAKSRGSISVGQWSGKQCTAWKLAPHSSAPHSTLIRLRTANYIHCLGCCNIDSWYS